MGKYLCILFGLISFVSKSVAAQNDHTLNESATNSIFSGNFLEQITIEKDLPLHDYLWAIQYFTNAESIRAKSRWHSDSFQHIILAFKKCNPHNPILEQKGIMVKIEKDLPDYHTTSNFVNKQITTLTYIINNMYSIAEIKTEINQMVQDKKHNNDKNDLQFINTHLQKLCAVLESPSLFQQKQSASYPYLLSYKYSMNSIYHMAPNFASNQLILCGSKFFRNSLPILFKSCVDAWSGVILESTINIRNTVYYQIADMLLDKVNAISAPLVEQ